MNTLLLFISFIALNPVESDSVGPEMALKTFFRVVEEGNIDSIASFFWDKGGLRDAVVSELQNKNGLDGFQKQYFKLVELKKVKYGKQEGFETAEVKFIMKSYGRTASEREWYLNKNETIELPWTFHMMKTQDRWVIYSYEEE